jgi:holo-ACP synthase CitX
LNVLEAREQRVLFIERLLATGHVILSLRVNYPGPNKDQELTQKIITLMHEEIIKQFSILSQFKLNQGEGPVHLYEIDSSHPLKVKEEMLQIENNHPLGRLIDGDVYYKSNRSLSRRTLGFKPRHCFICQEDAFICIRQQTHDLNQIEAYIKGVVIQYEK